MVDLAESRSSPLGVALSKFFFFNKRDSYLGAFSKEIEEETLSRSAEWRKQKKEEENPFRATTGETKKRKKGGVVPRWQWWQQRWSNSPGGNKVSDSDFDFQCIFT